MKTLLKKIVGNKNDRDVKKLRLKVAAIREKEETYASFTEDDLKAKTNEFRGRVADGETLDDILPEAFALVKIACRLMCGRSFDVKGHPQPWDMVPYDVQLIGGMVMHQHKIAEMSTGEGKTLVATLPVYLNALSGLGVHLVTVNDYLASRDAQWMGYLYGSLGLTVGCIQHDMRPSERREQYGADITYGTNSEFGFDYLRDNMARDKEEMVQRGHNYAVIDEIDSILIDEARVPLIISGPVPDSTHHYDEYKPRVERVVKKQRDQVSRLVKEAQVAIKDEDDELAMRLLYQIFHGMPKQKQFLHMLEDATARNLHEKIESQMLTDTRKEEARDLREELFFNIDEKQHDVMLTDKGCLEMDPSNPDTFVMPDLVAIMAEIDQSTSMTDDERHAERVAAQDSHTQIVSRIHNVDQLIRAYSLYERDTDYILQDNQVVIVDTNTGRAMAGRRWSEGLHQAVEAKEGVKIERETQTMATITIQNYFRMYDKLAGMTGTAETEAAEFFQIYKMDVIVIPTNRPVRRIDFNDPLYLTQREKYKAILAEISDCHERGQPVLVGTISVETSELISRMLKRQKIPHNVLNAKQHASEAEVVTRAGQPGAVTIATNMAGRGTDIKLGEGVVHLDRDVVTSYKSLSDKVDGSTLRAILEENPCGLHVIATERHESRRIDRQLRGRCARQGDPGSSRFFVSLEDDLMRLYGASRISSVMKKMGMEDGDVLESRMLNKSIETAQRRVEQQNFSIRKRTLEYDDVMNMQREVIYGLRQDVLQSDEVRPKLMDMIHDAIEGRAETCLVDDVETNPDSATEGSATGAGLKTFVEWCQQMFPVVIPQDEAFSAVAKDPEGAADLVMKYVEEAYAVKLGHENPEAIVDLERYVALTAIDTHWQEYLRSIDSLRKEIGTVVHGQKDPLVEFKIAAFDMFEELIVTIKEEAASMIFRSATSRESLDGFFDLLALDEVHGDVSLLGGAGGAAAAAPGQDPASTAAEEAIQSITRSAHRVGRNDPCPCRSGKKYKKCCGA